MSMRIGTAILMLLFIELAPAMAAGPTTSPSKPGWDLTFADEFDGPTLDESRWFPSLRTGMIQYYCSKGLYGWGREPRPAHYVLERGILKLRIDDKLPARGARTDFCVSSIQTSDFTHDPQADAFAVNNKFAQKYGWFEIRCRMPAGSGLCSAFWLLQTDPRDQEYDLNCTRRKLGDGVVEIDIFEMLGAEIGRKINRFNVHFTADGAYECAISFDASKTFHVWALEWNEGELTWYLDGRKVRTYRGPTPQKEMFVLLSLYHDGSGWMGKVDPKMPYPRDFEIDYIRVYQRQKPKQE